MVLSDEFHNAKAARHLDMILYNSFSVHITTITRIALKTILVHNTALFGETIPVGFV
jgi:hypothetical protein